MSVMSLIDRPVRDLLAAFGSSDPTPGGGSAAALASAVGASLLMMVAGLPKTRSGSDRDRTALAVAISSLTDVRRQLADAIDADTSAYDRVVAAYKLPKGTDEEKSARKGAIQLAMRGAIDVPLDVMRLSVLALEAAQTIAAHGHRGASSDVGVAIALLQCGIRGGRLNVDVNLTSIHDEAYASGAAGEVDRLAHAGATLAEAAETVLALP
jgi:methenyltetrahydrofolate cyclohydrolase